MTEGKNTTLEIYEPKNACRNTRPLSRHEAEARGVHRYCSNRTHQHGCGTHATHPYRCTGVCVRASGIRFGCDRGRIPRTHTKGTAHTRCPKGSGIPGAHNSHAPNTAGVVEWATRPQRTGSRRLQRKEKSGEHTDHTRVPRLLNLPEHSTEPACRPRRLSRPKPLNLTGPTSRERRRLVDQYEESGV